jgi:hypothetical protein
MENAMRVSKVSLAVLTAVALSAGAGAASAQSSTTTTTTTTISPDQETTIYRTITREQVAVQPPPPDWAPSVGIEVPAQVQLYDMPSSVDVPTVRSDRYTMINGHVVLVDPSTRRVIRIIEH